MEKLKKLKDRKLIKVITDVRRSGKSTLFSMFKEQVQKENNGNFAGYQFKTFAHRRAKSGYWTCT